MIFTSFRQYLMFALAVNDDLVFLRVTRLFDLTGILLLSIHQFLMEGLYDSIYRSQRSPGRSFSLSQDGEMGVPEAP